MSMTGAQVAQVLHQAGFRGQDLTSMVAIGKAESGWQPAAHRSDQDKAALSGDRGLFQINHIWDSQLIQAGIIGSKQDLFDPVTNARAAKYIWDRQGIQAWDMSKSNWQRPAYQTEANQAVQDASARGLFGQPYQGGGAVGPTGDSTGASQGAVTVPPDAQLIHIQGFGHFAVFEVGNGLSIHYHVDTFDKISQIEASGRRFEPMDPNAFNARFPGTVRGGQVDELATTTAAFGTFGELWNSILDTVMGRNNPARQDPGVLKVLAEFAGRPDMSEAELQNKLTDTQWYQSRTEGELEWNSLSEAERGKRRDDMAQRMVDEAFRYIGTTVDPTNPIVANHIEAVASGKMGYSAWVGLVKDLATDDEESPWSRQQRDEDEARKQRPIDVENTSQRIRETVERWGLQWSPETITGWAREMVEKDKSDEDLIMELRSQAQVLFPWKSPEVETATAAAPWLETYRRVMEKHGTLFTPEVQKAMQAGQPVFDFETDLKKSGGWLETKNGRNEMDSAVSEIGARMGFVNG